MKKFILILSTAFSISLYAQECFPTSNAIWNEQVTSNWIYDPNAHQKELQRCAIIGDTTINDTIFSRLYEIASDTMFMSEHTQSYSFLGWIKQKDKKVWFNNDQGYKVLLYDFGVDVGDMVDHNIAVLNTSSSYFFGLMLYDFPVYSSRVDRIEIGNNGEKIIYLNDDIWIEGIGSIYGIFSNRIESCTCPVEMWYDYTLACFKHNDSIKYLNNICRSCCNCSEASVYTPGINIQYTKDNVWNDTTDVYFDYSETPIQTSLSVNFGSHPYYKLFYPITYRWSTNSETYIIEDSTISNPAFSFLEDVSVYVKIFDRLGTTAYDTVNFFIQDPAGISEQNLSEISIFPNPASNILNIYLNNELINSIEIIDEEGKTIKKQAVNAEKFELNISDIKPSNYLIKIVTNRSTHIKKMVKKG